MTALWVEITETRGSVPRDTGTVMKVTATDIEGTIGGGALEFHAIHKARVMLANDGISHIETLPLGPNLGQCCGGSVTLRYTDQEQSMPFRALSVHLKHTSPERPKHLWLWGAGHVGRAVVQAAHPQVFKITWVDSSAERFPDHIDKHVTIVPATDMPRLAAHALKDAHHLIFTYSHDIDLALCAALLKRGVSNIGLIGSATKWARFRKRLAATGLDPAPITCPIGNKHLGKAPDQIAEGVIADLLVSTQPKATV